MVTSRKVDAETASVSLPVRRAGVPQRYESRTRNPDDRPGRVEFEKAVASEIPAIGGFSRRITRDLSREKIEVRSNSIVNY